jgi:hypothetical protein
VQIDQSLVLAEMLLFPMTQSTAVLDMSVSDLRIFPMPIRGPSVTESDGRVLKFRPRTLARPPAAVRDSRTDDDENASVDDARAYGRSQTQPDDYRHRMTTNVAAILFTALLTCLGIWLAVKLADLRKTQDCVLMGRRDCAHISSPKD